MPPFSDLAFARVVPEVPDTLMARLARSAPLSDAEDQLYTAICGIIPGYPEAFSSTEARDAALGRFGSCVKFVPATWAEAEAGGFPIASVAIGHALGDPAFEKVAPAILDAVASSLQDEDSHDIVIHRTRYVVRRLSNGAVKTYGWMSEFDGGAPIEVEDALETVAYLDRELNQRLLDTAGFTA
jgi:hypothetical protein